MEEVLLRQARELRCGGLRVAGRDLCCHLHTEGVGGLEALGVTNVGREFVYFVVFDVLSKSGAHRGISGGR
jgi:hypothetical protein